MLLAGLIICILCLVKDMLTLFINREVNGKLANRQDHSLVLQLRGIYNCISSPVTHYFKFNVLFCYRRLQISKLYLIDLSRLKRQHTRNIINYSMYNLHVHQMNIICHSMSIFRFICAKGSTCVHLPVTNTDLKVGSSCLFCLLYPIRNQHTRHTNVNTINTNVMSRSIVQINTYK